VVNRYGITQSQPSHKLFCKSIDSTRWNTKRIG